MDVGQWDQNLLVGHELLFCPSDARHFKCNHSKVPKLLLVIKTEVHIYIEGEEKN